MKPTPHLYKFLGPYSASRVESFKTLERLWDCGRSGERLQPKSLEMAEHYAQGLNYSQHVSVFMATEGNIVLAWDDEENKCVEIQFLGESGMISVFQEGKPEDSEFEAFPNNKRIPYPPKSK